MITVEDVVRKNAVGSTPTAKDNEELLKSGTIKEVRKSYLPWVLLALGAIGLGWYFLRKKGSGQNEGIPG
jgi:hypothetical protein